MEETIFDQARDIALAELHSCFIGPGIVAGTHHFTDYWARDGFFAAFGIAKNSPDSQIVEKMIHLFFENQRKDGLIPYRIMRGPVTYGKYVGHPKYYPSPKPTYRLRGIGQPIFDGATLTIISACNQSMDLIEQYEDKIGRALQYLNDKEKYGLLWDGVMAEWNDTANKWGNLLYSNLLYWHMYNRLFETTNNPIYQKKAASIRKSLTSRLWNGEYFADWNDYKRQDYFYTFGNLLAISIGLADEQQAESILRKAKTVVIDFTLETNTPRYPWWRIDVFHHLAGMGDYQNHSMLWWQPACAYVAALTKTKQKKEAKAFLHQMAKKIVNDQGLYECYNRIGLPVKRPFYQAEKPFAWAAGMYLWADNKVNRAIIHNEA